MDVNQELNYFENAKKSGGPVGWGWMCTKN